MFYNTITSRICLAFVSMSIGLFPLIEVVSAQAKNDGKSVNRSEPSAAKAASKATTVSTAALAYKLYAFGKEKGDAIQLLAASRILASVYDNLKTEGGELEHEGEAAPVEGEPANPSPASILEEARTAAAGNAALLTVIGQDAPADRSFVSSDQVYGRISTVGPNRDDPWKWRTAIADELAEVAISGNGRTDLDLFVYDENGNEICRSVQAYDDEYCSWVPNWTGGFRIVVQNFGSSANTYEMWIQ